jgi:hypothetical protein
VVTWLRLVEDQDRETVARKLGLSVGQVDAILFGARSIVHTLIAHANGNKVTDDEHRALWAFLDGKLSGRAYKLQKRHYDHCSACQRLARMRNYVEEGGAACSSVTPCMPVAS